MNTVRELGYLLENFVQLRLLNFFFFFLHLNSVFVAIDNKINWKFFSWFHLYYNNKSSKTIIRS